MRRSVNDAAHFERTAWGAGRGHGRLLRGRSRRASGCRARCSAVTARRAHDAGLAVIPWTVNDKPTMASLLDASVDGLITDYPDRLAARADGPARPEAAQSLSGTGLSRANTPGNDEEAR